jgi:hypothetical protein
MSSTFRSVLGRPAQAPYVLRLLLVLGLVVPGALVGWLIFRELALPVAIMTCIFAAQWASRPTRSPRWWCFAVPLAVAAVLPVVMLILFLIAAAIWGFTMPTPGTP